MTEREGAVEISLLDGIEPKIVCNSTARLARQGNIIYSEPFKGFDAVFFCSDPKDDTLTPSRFTRAKVYIDHSSDFWSFVQPRLKKYRGVSARYFPLYLKELEFRFNNQNINLTDRVAECICDLLPHMR